MTDNITVVRRFAAPRELVYSALVEKEHFSVWFGSDAVDVPVDEMTWDARVGGEWTAVMHLPDGTLKSWAGSFLELDPPSRVVFEMTDEPENPDRLPVSIDLVEVEGGTEITLVQATPGWPEEAKQGLLEGYGAFLDSLERLLARI